MQPGIDVLLALLLAHFLADFPLQTAWIAEGKARGGRRALLAHLATHLAVTVVALLVFAPALLLSARTFAALTMLIGGHALLDLGKVRLITDEPHRDGATLFLADQIAHLIILVLAWLIMAESTFALGWVVEFWNVVRPRLLVEMLVLVAFVFPTGYLIRYLLEPMKRSLTEDSTGGPPSEGLSNAGLVLGWIERALLVFAFAEASMTAIGLIVGAKSIARFPEFKTRAFAEYFLIGTLLSVTFAGIGGWLLRAARAMLTG